MSNSNSGIISTEFVNVSDSFSDYTDISQGNHNRLVKAKRFGKWYMLKGLASEYANKAVFVELLRKEFDLGIALDHPNIIRTIGKENDSYIGDCIVLEYIDGITLTEWIRTKPSKRERKRVVLQLLDAMSYFHSKGVIHRDLKPENILITRNGGNVKVIDFGLSDSDEYAILKQPAGSRKYSAPEQFEGKVHIDLRVDIYALGQILKELALYPTIVKKATQTKPEDRYANAQEIITAIRNRYRANFTIVFFVAIIILSFVIYTVVPYLQPTHIQPTADTIVREVLRDTITTIKEVPVERIVEKVVLKDIGESDSTYLARKRWEKGKIESAKKGLDAIYIPILAIAKKAKTKYQAYYQSGIGNKEVTDKYSKLREGLLEDIEKNSDFYFEFENRIAVMHGNYYMEYEKLISNLSDEIPEYDKEGGKVLFEK